MTEANKNTLIAIGDKLAYYIIPFALAGLLVRDAIFNALIDTGSLPFIVLLFLAGVMDAAKDTLAHHFSTSIFKKLNNSFWDASISWKNKYNNGNPNNGLKSYFKFPVLIVYSDGWHLFKGLHTICIIASIFAYTQITTDLWRDVLLAYGTYKYGFVLFYNKFLLGKV